MTENLQFDLKQGEALKSTGMKRAAKKRNESLELAKVIARSMAQYGDLTIDDVVCHLARNFPEALPLGNAAGSVFRGKGWELVGYRKSRRVARHAGMIGIWRLK